MQAKIQKCALFSHANFNSFYFGIISIPIVLAESLHTSRITFTVNFFFTQFWHRRADSIQKKQQLLFVKVRRCFSYFLTFCTSQQPLLDFKADQERRLQMAKFDQSRIFIEFAFDALFSIVTIVRCSNIMRCSAAISCILMMFSHIKKLMHINR